MTITVEIMQKWGLSLIHIFEKVWTKSYPYFDKFYAVYNMISVEYRHVYQLVILTMVRSMPKNILNNLLAVDMEFSFIKYQLTNS